MTMIKSTRRPPTRLISHACTAAILCLITFWMDYHLGFDYEVRRIVIIELLLAIYGVTVTLFSFANGDLRLPHRIILTLCLIVFLCSLSAGIFIPRLTHNEQIP